MGVRNRDREVIERLDSKTLDARFLSEMQHGLDCAPLVSKAIWLTSILLAASCAQRVNVDR